MVGGGIDNSLGTLVINNSTFDRNSSYSGGGLHNQGTFTVSNSTFVSNTAYFGGGGSIMSGGSGSHGIIDKSTLYNNATFIGGGIYNETGTLTITNSSIHNNSSRAVGGGIYNNDGTLLLKNSTISGNLANIDTGNGGGGVFNDNGTVFIDSSSIISNSAVTAGGSLYNISGTVTITNSILAYSGPSGDCHNRSGEIIDGGHNIVQDNSCGFTGGSNPMLGSLQDNGGPTFTHALLPGSPAINAGDTALTVDQRGISRPQGAADDIGAFEAVNYSYLPMIIK